ncbi:MAG: 3-keto-5-aminohexanoate cleavage protein [Candidatus Binataceae bacterium]|nr:3-keto-5-aminohexanoate cleavage protein [Candidatus Binataceae bacterium]
MNKLIIEVRINEYASRKHNANVPFSPAEICEEALRCWRAGASIVHYHARDPHSGAPSALSEIYGETARRIRDQTDLLVMPTLGAWTLPSPEARMSHIIELARDPATRPDFAPIDMGTSNVDAYDARNRRFISDETVYLNTTRTLQFFARTIREAGVRPVAVLWNVSAIRTTAAFVEAGLFEEPVYSEIVLTEGGLFAGNPGTVRGLAAMADFFPASIRMPWTVMCAGGNLFPIVGAAIERGGHIAIGLGDYPYTELGTPRNAELVERVAGMARVMGREVATPSETRSMLGIG